MTPPLLFLLPCVGAVPGKVGCATDAIVEVDVSDLASNYPQTGARKHLPGKLAKALWRAKGWLLSVVSPSGEGRVVMAPLCPACAEVGQHPDVLKTARASLRSQHGEPGAAS